MNLSYQDRKSYQMASIALVATIYFGLSFITAPLVFGPLNFRVAEGLNFLALYNRRHIWALSLGVFLTNYFVYGPLDMIIGSLSTLIFLHLGAWLADILVNQSKSKAFNMDSILIKYGILAITFSLSMISIALMIKFLGYSGPFLALYLGLFFSELVAMIIGSLLVYPMSKRINLSK